MTKVAIIPARGGSKRLPRKNILPVLGKPILFYPVTTSLKSGLFDQVIVSTEDSEIKEAAKNAGARVMDRPVELAQDRASVVQVCLNVLDELFKEGIQPKYFCCIYATAIFITPEDLKESFLLMTKNPETSIVMGVSEFNLQPVQALEDKDGYLRLKWLEYKELQSQFQPQLVASNGTLYWGVTSSFLESKSFYLKKLKGYKIPWIKAIDLDTPEDLRIAQMIAPQFLNKHH